MTQEDIQFLSVDYNPIHDEMYGWEAVVGGAIILNRMQLFELAPKACDQIDRFALIHARNERAARLSLQNSIPRN